MISIQKVSETESYILEINNTLIHAMGLDRLIYFMLSFGIIKEEVEYGLTEMIKHNHSILEYDINKTFLFSK